MEGSRVLGSGCDSITCVEFEHFFFCQEILHLVIEVIMILSLVIIIDVIVVLR